MRTDSMVSRVPQLARGQVWCRTCGRSQHVDSQVCLATGWPTCCGYTMTIDSPKEQKQARSRPALRRVR